MKWLYRMESTNPKNGLWYNEDGAFVFGINEINNCVTREMPMGYDERYQQGGKSWFSSCSNVEDLTHWYSVENAKELLEKGFKFYRYLAIDYHEYENETVFLKETSLDKVEISFEELFGKVSA